MIRRLALSFFLAASAASLHASPPPASYRIGGIVVDSVTGQPLEGAEANISPVANLADQQTFLTSSTGRFLFSNLPAGKYRLMASRRGYAMQAFYEHEAFSTAIVVGPGLDTEHIHFPLTPSSAITGVLTDDWGDPVRDAKVLLFQQSMFDGSRGLRNINQATTDDQGRYRFAHLRSGTYAVAVYSKPWYAQSQMQIQVVDGDINISKTQIIEQAAEGKTFDDPRHVFSVDPLFDVVYPVTFFPNATSLAEAARIALAPGATQTADLQLRAVPSVHLRVRVPAQITPVTVTSGTADSEGNAQEGSSDTPEIESSPDVGLAFKIGDSYTDQIEPARKQIAPGLVELSGIPPGQVEVNLSTGSMLTGPDDSVVSHGRTLNLSGDTELDLSAQGDAAAVSGVVLSSRFKPPPAPTSQASPDQAPSEETSPAQAQEGDSYNEMVAFRSVKTGETYDATISGHGEFSFAASILRAGSYEVEFSGLSSLPGQAGLRVSSIEANGAAVSGRTIQIPAGQPVNLTVHAAEANCTLSGFALKNGKPVAGAMVLLVPQDPGHDMSLYHRDQSDSDGSFTLPAIFPGRYILLAIENGWDLEWADPKVMFQYLPGGQPLELRPNASLTLNAKVQ